MVDRRPPRTAVAVAVVALVGGLALAAACSSTPGDGAADMRRAGPPPVESVPLQATLTAPGLSAPVDVVRDTTGVPHIYGATFADVAYAQGYVTAADRIAQMDLARRNADGTLAEIAGSLNAAAIDVDIRMRLHHLRATATAGWHQLQASTDPRDRIAVALLTRFAAGVNAWLADWAAGKAKGTTEVAFLVNSQTVRPWTEVDSILLGQLLAFQLGFDATSDIDNTRVEAAATAKFDNAADPALRARKGIARDFAIFAPVDSTHTIEGWTGMNGDTSRASLDPRPDRRGRRSSTSARGAARRLLALLDRDRPTVGDVGNVGPDRRGSNSWAVAPALSAGGHALLASDPHLSLGNPTTLYQVHLVARGGELPVDAHGLSLAGVPGIVLGFNRHLAWGATVNYIDLTDVYQESVVDCDGGGGKKCVVWKGQKVPLVERKETIGVGTFTELPSSVTVTYYDVPHHGPIIPRITKEHALEPLGASELSIRYTGYEPAPIVRLVIDLPAAQTLAEGVAAVDKGAIYADQNWVFADDHGRIGWTQATRVPRRAPGAAPWKVLPGDGSAEWGGDMDPRYVPHAYEPAKGYLATANADPIGVTDDDEPFFDEPMVDGAPLYLGWDYDPGTRVGRITRRLVAGSTGGKKLSLDDMQSIQADAVTEWGQLLAPTLLDAGKALAGEIDKPGSHPEVAAILKGASATSRGLVGKAVDLVGAWSFDTPSAVAEESPTADQIRDSQATLVYNVWRGRFFDLAIGDELALLGDAFPPGSFTTKLLVRMCVHPELLHTGIAKETGDALLFDDLATPDVVESKRQIAARALLAGLDDLVKKLGADPAGWRWGKLHTLTLEFLTPVGALRVPKSGDAQYPNGFPRHGDKGTVDPADHARYDFTYAHGPVQRLVVELDPASGPRARNAIPGGEVLDPASPHYRDQLERWRRNQTFDLPYREEDVATAGREEQKTNGIGRVRFQP